VAQEHLSASWARMTGGAAVGLRYHNVYGPRMPRDTPYSGVAAIFRSCLERGAPPRVFEDGGQRRDFVHVRDVAQANVLALEAADQAVAGAGLGVAGAGLAGVPAEAGAGVAGVSAGAGPGAPFSRGVQPGGLRCYNVASGEPHTVGDMAGALAAAFGAGLDPVVTGEFRLGDVRHIVASPAAAAAGLGFRAQIGFAAGMTEFAHAPLREPAILAGARG
jgi:dTDP-L-rhamnose 4-epimerase